MLNDKSIPNSQFFAMRVVHDNTAGRASSRGWGGVVSTRAAGASMHEEGTSPAHLILFLGFQVEGAGSLHGGVHDVDAGGQFVGSGGRGPILETHCLAGLL